MDTNYRNIKENKIIIKSNNRDIINQFKQNEMNGRLESLAQRMGKILLDLKNNLYGQSHHHSLKDPTKFFIEQESVSEISEEVPKNQVRYTLPTHGQHDHPKNSIQKPKQTKESTEDDSSESSTQKHRSRSCSRNNKKGKIEPNVRNQTQDANEPNNTGDKIGKHVTVEKPKKQVPSDEIKTPTNKRPISASPGASVIHKENKRPVTAACPRSRSNSSSKDEKVAVITNIQNLSSSRKLDLNVRNKTPPNHNINRAHKSKPQEIVDSLRSLKDRVTRAIQEKKTFTVSGNYNSIRRALVTRGWVEKIYLTHNTQDRDTLKKVLALGIPELLPEIHDHKNGLLYKRVIMSKLLGQHQVDFFWDQNYDGFRVNFDKVKLTMISHFKPGVFCTNKSGLCDAAKRAHWYQRPGVWLVRHPRSYDLSKIQDTADFIYDFKLTATMGLLKWAVKTGEQETVVKLVSNAGKIDLSVFHFAMAECEKYLKRCTHQDIDCEIAESTEYQWNNFLQEFYKIAHFSSHFKSNNFETVQSLVEKAKEMLSKIQTYWSDINMDGMMNIWILKPVTGTRGMGIHICRTLEYVLKVIKANSNKRYLIQKYIERPLLIRDTKFDIRQWYLITNTHPLTIWMYRECYIRFSSQTYNLRKLHESIHLTNNSVQCHYENSNRDPALPKYNMWDSHQFKQYLENIGHPLAFKNTVYPGMKECIVAAVLMNQNAEETRKNCFELYGADFMLTEDFKPWLIEINSRPALYASTPVTGRMCPQVLEDVVKVVVDHAKNPKSYTGRFELAYQEKLEKLPSKNVQQNLLLEGKPLPPNYFYTPVQELTLKKPTTSPNSKKVNAKASPPTSQDHTKKQCEEIKSINKEIKNTLEKSKKVNAKASPPPTSEDHTKKKCEEVRSINKEMKITLENILHLIQSEQDRRQSFKKFQSEPAMAITNSLKSNTTTNKNNKIVAKNTNAEPDKKVVCIKNN